MKTKIKRHYRSVVSVLLSVCMLVSCMTVGLIATDAAQITGDEAVGAIANENSEVGASVAHIYFRLLQNSTVKYSIDMINATSEATAATETITAGTYKCEVKVVWDDALDGGVYCKCDYSDNQTIGDNWKYKWFKSGSSGTPDHTFSGQKYAFYHSGDNPSNHEIQVSIVKAPENNPTKITAGTGCTATVSNGTTTITSTGSESSGSLTQNSTATVTITPPAGKKVTTATLTGGTSQTLNLTSNLDGTYSATYTVPSNTTETAITFSEPVDKSSYKVNVVSSDVSEGTVAATVGGSALDPDTSYPEDTAITLTATAEDGFSFVKWDYKTTTDSSANPATYYVNGADATGTTINITGEFGENGYQIKIGDGSWNVMEQLKNGNYISTSTVANATTFQLKRTDDGYLAKNSSNAGDYWINSGGVDTVTWVASTSNAYSNRQGGERYVVYNPTTQKVWLSDDPQGHTPTTVLVKRGAVFSNDNGISSTGTSVKNGTNVVSATVAGANKTSGFSDQWQEKNSNPAVYYVRQVEFTAAEVGKGAKITVATTVTDSSLKVVGFVVNGESVLGSDITVSGNTYTMTYAIPEYPDPVIEITPVYAKTSGTIRFYVEGIDGDIREKWGDTVYCYAYYKNKTTGTTYGVSGTWPGQPLLYDNGRYFINLEEQDNGEEIVGIALNNGTWDDVHAYRIIGSGRNDTSKNERQCQSYDYDDFVKINTLENAKKTADASYVKADIIFEMKSKGVVEPASSNFGTTFDTTGNNYPGTIDVNNFTDWEYLTDYYGNRVDVFGNIIDPTNEHYSDDPYRLVSQGYDENSVGYFATAWVVYQQSGSTYNKLTTVGSSGYVGTNSESKFLDSGLEDTAGWSALKGKPAMITYEYGVYQEKGNGGNSDDGGKKPATRYDGRWYASKFVPVKAHTLIEYGRTEHGTFRRDYYQENSIDYTSASGYDSTKTEGLVTKTKAHFSESPNLTESEKTTEKNEDGSSVNKFNFVAEDDAEGKYTFIGWYKYNAKGEAERVSTKKNYSVDVKNEEVLIARFIKTPAGTVTITHELLTGSEGLGTTLNSVSVVESDKDTLVAAFDPNPVTTNSTGAAKLPSIALTVENTFDTNNSNADRGRLVKIVLNTTPNGATFQHFHYDIDKSGNPAQLTASAPGSPFEITLDEANATATIYVPLSYFFKDESGDKVFDEDNDTLKFYSELIVSSKSLTITKKLTSGTDASTAFTVAVTLDGNAYQGAWKLNGTAQTDTTTGVFTVNQDDVIAIEDIPVNSTMVVSETDIPFNYTLSKITVGSDTDTDVKGTPTNGYTFDITDDTDVTIWNAPITYHYSITYAYDSYRDLHKTQKYKVTGDFDNTTAKVADYLTVSDTVYDDDTKSNVTAYWFKGDNERKNFINILGPYENNYRQKLYWNTDMKSSSNSEGVSIVYSSSTHTYTIDVNVIASSQKFVDLIFKLPYNHDVRSTAYAATETDGKVLYNNALPDETISNLDYGTWFASNGVKYGETGTPQFVSAPLVIYDGTQAKGFKYWTVKTVATDLAPSVEYTKCYYHEFNLSIYQDSIVEPHYENITAEEAANYSHNAHEEAIKAGNANGAVVTFIENSRNQYNMNNQNITQSSRRQQGDRIYTDFLLSYASESDLKFQDYADGTYTAGLAIQKVALLDDGADGKDTSVDYATKYGANLDNMKYNGVDFDKTTLESFIKGNADYDDAIGLERSEFDANKLDNKNRIQYYYSYSVRSHTDLTDNGNKDYVYRAFAYMKDSSGNVTMVSQPLYFTFYDMASIANAQIGYEADFPSTP